MEVRERAGDNGGIFGLDNGDGNVAVVVIELIDCFGNNRGDVDSSPLVYDGLRLCMASMQCNENLIESLDAPINPINCPTSSYFFCREPEESLNENP